MPEPRLDAHGSKVVQALFEEDTATINSVGDIVEKHSGDSLILTPSISDENNIDEGEAEFEEDALPTDPTEFWESVDDEYAGSEDEDEEGIGETDLTGTVVGIARGFGSHVPLDLGSDGFQIEELPDRVVTGGVYRGENEELDDYDDADTDNGKFDSKSLREFEQPGANPVDDADDEEMGAIEPRTS